MITLTPITVTASRFTQRLPIHDPTQCTALILKNESAYDLSVSYNSSQKTIAAWTVDVIVTNGAVSSLDITPTLNLPNVVQPNNLLTIMMYDPADVLPSLSQYPESLTRATQGYGQPKSLGQFTSGASGSLTETVTLPPDCETLMIISQSGTTSITVTGVTTGWKYYDNTETPPTSIGLTQRMYCIPMSDALDAQVQINSTDNTNNPGFFVISLPYPLQPSPQIVTGTVSVEGIDGTGAVNPIAEYGVLPNNNVLKSVALTDVAGGTTFLAGSGTKVITVYGYSLTWMPPPGAVAGNQFAGNIIGTTSATVVAEGGGFAYTFVGFAGTTTSIWLPPGIVCAAGEGLKVNATANAINVTGTLYYTQI